MEAVEERWQLLMLPLLLTAGLLSLAIVATC